MNGLIKLPSFYGVIEVKKSVPGMIRVEVEKLKNNQELIEELKENLEKISVINSFKILPSLGMLTINYDQNQIDKEFMYGVLLNLLDLEEEAYTRKKSKIKTAIQNGCEILDISLYNKTKGLLDIKTLTGLILIGYGLKQLKASTATKTGASFLWWAYSLLSDRR